MEVVKRNLFSIVSGAVALLAMILGFYPFSGWFTELGTKLKQSQVIHTSLNQVLNAPFTIPPFDLDLTAEPTPLGHFPSPKNIEDAKKLVDELKGQSDKLTGIVMKWNEKVPLVPGVFPAGANRFTFKSEYYRALDTFKKAMNATSPPTNTEVAAEMKKFSDMQNEKILITADGKDNKADIQATITAKSQTMAWDMCCQRAKEFSVYVSTKALDPCSRDGYMPPAADQSLPPDVESCWAAQMCIWIESDIVQAIIQTNKLAKGPGIENSLVKRLVKLDIAKKYMTIKGEMGYALPRFMGGGGNNNANPGWDPARMAAAANVNDTSTEAEAPSTKVYAASATGRVSNSLYDVVHFTLIVDCDANQFRAFMANLVKDRFITILRTDFIGVDRDKEMNKGILYGQTPVIRVAMKCEALFFREWTKKYVPANVRKIIKMPEETAPAAG